jgi:hypothetical protein
LTNATIPPSRPGRHQSAARRGGRGCRPRHRRSRRVLDGPEHSAMLIRDWDASYRPPRRGYRPAKNPTLVGSPRSELRRQGLVALQPVADDAA